MSLVDPSQAGPVCEPPVATAIESEPWGRRTSWPRRIGQGLATLLRLGVGMLLCFHYLTSVLVVGWTFRWMRRSILQGWWRRSPIGSEIDLERVLARTTSRPDPLWKRRAWRFLGVFRLDHDDVPIAQGAVPRWLVRERFWSALNRPRADGRPRGAARWLRAPGLLLSCAWDNLRVGMAALVCTYILTGPACLLWLGSWYDGWNNSFHKGYEQAAVGPLTGILGIVLFILAMQYVPMAWAHLAATGDPRAFFDFGFVRRLIRCRRLAVTLHAALFAVLSLVPSVLRVVPVFLGNSDPAFEEASLEELREVAALYNLGGGAALFPTFVLVHLSAAWIYRGAVLGLLRRDPLAVLDLHPNLRETLNTLRLLEAPERPRRHPLVTAAVGTGRWLTISALWLTSALLWFTVAAQVYIAEFFNHHPALGWLNQPLIHLPSLFLEPTASP